MKKNFAEKIASTFGYDWVVGNDSLLWPQLQIHSNKRWINCCLTDALSQLVSSYVLALPLISCLPTTFIKNTSFSQKTKIITLWKKDSYYSSRFPLYESWKTEKYMTDAGTCMYHLHSCTWVCSSVCWQQWHMPAPRFLALQLLCIVLAQILGIL